MKKGPKDSAVDDQKFMQNLFLVLADWVKTNPKQAIKTMECLAWCAYPNNMSFEEFRQKRAEGR